MHGQLKPRSTKNDNMRTAQSTLASLFGARQVAQDAVMLKLA